MDGFTDVDWIIEQFVEDALSISLPYLLRTPSWINCRARIVAEPVFRKRWKIDRTSFASSSFTTACDP